MANTKTSKNSSVKPSVKQRKTTSKRVKRRKKQAVTPIILQVLPSLDQGGVERGTIDIAKAAKAAKIGSFVASSGGKLVEELNKDMITHIQLPLASKNIFTMWLNIGRLVKVIKTHDINVVHVRSRAPAWSAYFAAKKTGAHFVTTFHGTYSLKGMGKRWYNSIMTRGEVVIAISTFIRDHIIQHYPVDEKKIVVIPRGVDLSYFNPNKVTSNDIAAIDRAWKPHHDYPVILLPGRITQWKGHEFVLRSLAKLDTHEYICIFMGKFRRFSKYVERIKYLKQKFNLRGNVSIVEPTQDMRAAYKRADLVISASLRPEAFGRVAVEAQAMGVPLIATNIGGSKETVIDCKTGRLVEPENEAALAELIHDALAITSEQRKKMGKVSRKHIEDHFALSQMIDKTLDVYRKVVN